MKITRGFTLIELLIVIAILVALSTIVLTSFYNYQSRRSLELAVKEARQLLEEARSRSVASVDDSVYGVYIATDKMILFQGNTYDPNDENNSEFLIEPRLTISEVSLTPSTDRVVFEKGTGEASATGFIEISLVSKSEEKRQITISKQGIISSNE